jgi:hypothetical protein
LRRSSSHAIAEAEEESAEERERKKDPENGCCPKRDFAVSGSRVLKIVVAVV